MSQSNSMVAHKWAHGQAAKGSNFQAYDDGTLYSYGTLVGFNTGRGLVFLSASSMTSSTGKQLSHARHAVNHLDVIYSPVFRYGRGGYGTFNQQAAYDAACSMADNNLQHFAGAELSKYLHDRMLSAIRCSARLTEYGVKYGYKPFKFSSIPADKIEAARLYSEQFEEKQHIASVKRLERERVASLAAFEAWRQGESVPCPNAYRRDEHGGYYIAVRGDKVVTSGGAECPVDHARAGVAFWASRKHTGIEPACIFEPWQRNGHTVRLGVFQLDRIDAQGNAYAGCHKFTAEELNRLYHLLV